MSSFAHHLCLVFLFLSSSVPSSCRPWWSLLYSSGVQTGEMFISSCWLECNCCDLVKEQAEGCALHQCCHVLVGGQAWLEHCCCRPALFGWCRRRGRSLKGGGRSHLCKHTYSSITGFNNSDVFVTIRPLLCGSFKWLLQGGNETETSSAGLESEQHNHTNNWCHLKHQKFKKCHKHFFIIQPTFRV